MTLIKIMKINVFNIIIFVAIVAQLDGFLRTLSDLKIL